MKKTVSLFAGGLLVVAAGVGVIYMKEIERAAFALNLFSGAEQYENFGRLAELFPVTTMTASPSP